MPHPRLTAAAAVQVSGNVWIEANPSLRNLDALSNLVDVGYGFNLKANNRLQSLSGLGSLEHVGGSMGFTENDGLRTTAGLDSLHDVGELICRMQVLEKRFDQRSPRSPATSSTDKIFTTHPRYAVTHSTT